MVSICEVSIAALMEKFDISRKKAVTLYCLVGIVSGTVFATHSGLLVLDIVDRFIDAFSLDNRGKIGPSVHVREM